MIMLVRDGPALARLISWGEAPFAFPNTGLLDVRVVRCRPKREQWRW
jgi:hypothetical protein